MHQPFPFGDYSRFYPLRAKKRSNMTKPRIHRPSPIAVSSDLFVTVRMLEPVSFLSLSLHRRCLPAKTHPKNVAKNRNIGIGFSVLPTR